MKLTQENIEEYILLLVDDELDDAAVAEVNTFIATHEEYRTLLDAYLSVKLDAGDAMAYPDKAHLLKAEPVAIPLQRPYRWLWSGAAVVVLMLGLSLILLRKGGDEKALPVVTLASSQAVPAKVPPVVQPAVDEDTSPASPAAVAKTTVRKQHVTTAKERAKPQPVAGHTDAVAYRVKETIPALDTRMEPRYLSEASPVVAARSLPGERAPAMLVSNRSLPTWVPVKEESLEGMNDLVNQAQELRNNISEKARMLKKASFVIRIGDKDILALGH